MFKLLRIPTKYVDTVFLDNFRFNLIYGMQL